MPAAVDGQNGAPTTELRRGGWLRDSRTARGARAAQRWVSAVTYARRYNEGLPDGATVLHFHPMRPQQKARIAKIMALLDLRIGHGVHPGQPTIAWETGTWLSAGAATQLPRDAINGSCLDVSKTRVDAVWKSIAGYSVEVDPLVTDGPMVIKSDLNSRHDGRIVRGPLRQRRRGYVYQRFVDAVEGDSIVDLRATIMGGEICALVRCWRPATRWYGALTRMVSERPADVYSQTEIERILEFAACVGLDYGELDIIRDKVSGLIYVLDANRTPYGPSPGMTSAEAGKVTALMADGFARLIAARWP